MQYIRIALGIAGVALIVYGLAFIVSGGEGIIGLYPLVLGLAALAIAVFERARYAARRQTDASAAGMRRTDEVFVDPTTGQRTRVWVNSSTGEREYRPDA